MELQLGTSYGTVERALSQRRCIVLDGGVATELTHRSSRSDERLWGIEALASAPDEVRSLHRAYVEAQVDVLTTNTWALPTVVQSGGSLRGPGNVSFHWMDFARRGLELARDAIADAGREGDCAVALSLNGDIVGPDGPETVELLARAVAAEPPDLLLVETLSVLRPELFLAVEALVATTLPVWLSFRRCSHGLCGVHGEHWGGPEREQFGRAARRFEELGVSALLVNCVPPDHVPGIVGDLRDFTDLPLGVYPNLGYHTTSGWRSPFEIDGDAYAAMALEWREEGAQIVGGCCGTGPEHIRAAQQALLGTEPGSRQSKPPRAAGAGEPVPDWKDRRGNVVYPVRVPSIERHGEQQQGGRRDYVLWRHLVEEGEGAHQRCLDIGCGAGLLSVQLALNGAAHVHALDIDEGAVASTLTNAFRNGVAEQVTAEAADVFPWVPGERYELIVADLPQTPVDPLVELNSHRRIDYWGRGLVDQVLRKLPDALASEGRALVTVTSLLSARRTNEMLTTGGLASRVIAWEMHDVASQEQFQQEHVERLEHLGEGHLLRLGGSDVLVTYLLEIWRADQQPVKA